MGARKERLKRRPRMIVLENTPEELGEDDERSTDKPDYGLEELSSANVKQKFSMFENKGKEKDDRPLEPAHVRRSQSLMNKAARFLKEGDDEDSEGEYGVDNKYLGEHGDEEKEDKEKDEEDKDEEEKEDEDEDEVKQNGFDEEEPKPKKKVTKIIKVKKEKVKKEKKEKKSRRERPMSIAGAQAGELKQQWESKNRRDKMRETRSKELSKFRAMLCAGKNTNLKEMFESGKIDNYDSDDERSKRKEQIKIERAQQARSIKDRFEKGEAFGDKDSDDDRNYTDERRECEEIFREAETARAARKRFNQIDSKVKRDGGDIMRTQSFANAPISNRRLSQDAPVATEIVRSSDVKEDFEADKDLASKFNFFSNYEDSENKKVDEKRRSRSFRFTPPREGVVKVEEEKEFMAKMPKACMAINCPVCRTRGLEATDAPDFGIVVDPNYVRSSDKQYDENIDCARTKKLLDMFKKMEMQNSDEDERGPPPPRRFTPPPEGEEYDSEEYSEGEYTDDDDEEDDEDDEEEEEDEYEEIEVTDEDAEEEEEGTKVNGTKVNGVHDDENEEEDEDDEEKEDKEKDEEDKDEEEKEEEETKV